MSAPRRSPEGEVLETVKRRQKILHLLKILQQETDDEHSLSLPDIRQKLMDYGIVADRKALYLDLEGLIDHGYGIESTFGRTACYKMVSREFELAELKLLADAVSSAKFLSKATVNELIDKLGTLCSRYQRDQLKRDVLVTSRKCMTPQEGKKVLYNVSEIHRAINENKKISFKYFYYNKKKSRTQRKSLRLISPYNLVWNDEQYYLIGYEEAGKDGSEGCIKNFRVDRMTEVQVTTEQRRKAPKGYSAERHVEEAFSMFSGETVTVELKFMHEYLMNSVIDKFGTEVKVIKNAGDSFNVLVPVIPSGPFYGWLFQFGDEVEIVGPANIRKEYKELLQKVSGRY